MLINKTMGYTTTFSGQLFFKKELVASQLAKLSKILGEYSGSHPEWNADDDDLIQFELNEYFSGIKWEGGKVL